jgi:hypothetical protein
VPQPPRAANLNIFVVNIIANTTGLRVALNGTSDPVDGPIAYFVIETLPPKGQLFLNGAPVTRPRTVVQTTDQLVWYGEQLSSLDSVQFAYSAVGSNGLTSRHPGTVLITLIYPCAINNLNGGCGSPIHFVCNASFPASLTRQCGLSCPPQTPAYSEPFPSPPTLTQASIIAALPALATTVFQPFVQCSCTRGFTGATCLQDSNECNTNFGGCGSGPGNRCVNTYGSFYCTCADGYTGTWPHCHYGRLSYYWWITILLFVAIGLLLCCILWLYLRRKKRKAASAAIHHPIAIYDPKTNPNDWNVLQRK